MQDVVESIIFLILAVAILIFIINVWRFFSAKSAYKKTFAHRALLPTSINTTRNGLTVCPNDKTLPTVCPKCGSAFEKGYCVACGEAKCARYTYRFPLKDKTTIEQAEVLLDEWFAQNTFVNDCKLDLAYSPKKPFFPGGAVYVKEMSITFTLYNRQQPYQYGAAAVRRNRIGGDRSDIVKDMVTDWHLNNAEYEPLSYDGGKRDYELTDLFSINDYYLMILFRHKWKEDS